MVSIGRNPARVRAVLTVLTSKALSSATVRTIDDPTDQPSSGCVGVIT